MNFIEIATSLVILIPIIVGINELVKKVLPNLNTRFYPVLNLLLGFIAFPMFEATLYIKVLVCVVLGLAAGGFYDFGKKTVANK